MSTSRKLKSQGMRRGKNRTPHKGVKRSGSKRKYRKSSLKSRKRCDDGELGMSGRGVKQGTLLSWGPFLKLALIGPWNLNLRISFSTRFPSGQEEDEWGSWIFSEYSNWCSCCILVPSLQPIAICAPTCDSSSGLCPGGLWTTPGSNRTEGGLPRRPEVRPKPEKNLSCG